MLKAIVFDLDGTLVHSPLCLKSARDKLGVPRAELILEYLAKLPGAVRAAKFKELESIELEAAHRAVPSPGAVETLENMRRRGLRSGVFTRNCRAATEVALAKAGLSLDRLITRDDAAAKPDPAGLDLLLTEWQIEPAQMLYVGDFRHDIVCGKRARVKTALYTNGATPDETWGADHVIHSFYDFTRIGLL